MESVHLQTLCFHSRHCTPTSLRRPIKMSVASVLSWASSRMMTPYRSRRGSFIASRSSIPSVIYLHTKETEHGTRKVMGEGPLLHNAMGSSREKSEVCVGKRERRAGQGGGWVMQPMNSNLMGRNFISTNNSTPPKRVHHPHTRREATSLKHT